MTRRGIQGIRSFTLCAAVLPFLLASFAGAAHASRDGVAPALERIDLRGDRLRACLRAPKTGFDDASLEAASRALIERYGEKGVRRIELLARDAKGRVVPAESLLPPVARVTKRKGGAASYRRGSGWLRPLVSRVTDLAAAARSNHPARGLGRLLSAGPPSAAPGQTRGFLTGKTIYLSAGHGWTHGSSGAWSPQRGNTHDIVEDFVSAEAVNQLLVPLLLNAGATVFTVREPDLQEEMVVVDAGEAGYAEDGSGFRPSTAVGFAALRAPYEAGINPMRSGSTRELAAGPTSTAVARFAPRFSAAGRYQVYVSYAAGADRAPDAHYVVKHPGGETHYRVDQRRHGQTWVPLGAFWFEAGEDAPRGSVELRGDSANAGVVVSLDAVRFGGGLGDVSRGGGVSGKRRWEEAARYYAQFSGAPTSVYDQSDTDGSDDVGTRSRYAAWQHEAGEDALYLAWHTNAPSPAVGTSTFVYGPNPPDGNYTFTGTAGSDRLARLVHDEIIADLRASWSPGWRDRGVYSAYFGEVNPRHNNEMPAALVEVAFHSTEADAEHLKEARFRLLVTRAMYQGIARYFAERDAIPVELSPDPPERLVVRSDGPGRVSLSWRPAPADRAGGDAATGYRVYRSRDGRAFDDGIAVSGTEATLRDVPAGTTVFVRVAATNAGGESFPTPTLAARPARSGAPPLLLVHAFDRLDAAGLVREPASGLGTLSRMFLTRMNRYDYVIEHARAAAAAGIAFDSAHGHAVGAGEIDLSRYRALAWMAGEESTADRSFSAEEQEQVRAFAAAGGALFVSGSEIAWDLGARGNAASQAFLRDVLHADYAADDGMAARLTGTGALDGAAPLTIDDGTMGAYAIGFPDVLAPGTGATAALLYEGSTRVAAIAAPGVFFVGVPFEATFPEAARHELFARAMSHLAVPPEATLDGGTAPDGGDDGVVIDGGMGDGGATRDAGGAQASDAGTLRGATGGGCAVTAGGALEGRGADAGGLLLLMIAACWSILRGRPGAALLAAFVLGGCAALGPAKVTLFHVNDIYEAGPVDGRGGFAPLMTVLERERRRAKDHLTVFGGDLISPSLLSSLTKGAHMVELGNAVGIDVAVIGNHELDHGLAVLEQRVAESRFPWLATNVRVGGGKTIARTAELAMREVGDVRVGFFGLLTPDAAFLSPPTVRLEIEPLRSAATRAVAELKKRGAEVIVALTHLTTTEDRALARDVDGVDVILGGHDHEPMAFVENGRLVFKAGSDAEYLGVIELAIERGPRGVSPAVRVWPASWRHVSTRGAADHAGIAALVKRQTATLDVELGKTVAKTPIELDSRGTSVRSRETALGSLFADAMREGMKAEIALLNGGSVRGNRVYPAGSELTRKDVLRELPFRNVVVVIELSGADLRAALEHAVSAPERSAGRFLQVSGLRYRYAAAEKLGRRVEGVTVGGAPLDDQRKYKVAVTEFLARGGDGHASLSRGKLKVDPESAPLLVNLVFEYLGKHGIKAPSVGRVERR